MTAKPQTAEAERFSDLQAEVERLRPWRYSHSVSGVQIRSEFPAADEALNGAGRGRDIVGHIVRCLIADRDPAEMRVLDLGCLEGHYTAIFCALGFKEVVGIDLSEGHLARAEFLLKTLHGFDNVTLVSGNVNDSAVAERLGRFDIILCHGLLYHLKDPLLLFDSFERLLNPERPSHVMLSTQFKGSFLTIVDERPMLEMQHKTIGELKDGILHSPNDGSSFERLSLRMNPAAIRLALKAYGYRSPIAYDTPQGDRLGFALNLVMQKSPSAATERLLANDHDIEGLRFSEWNGRDLNGFSPSQGLFAPLLWRAYAGGTRLVDQLTVRRRLNRRAGKVAPPQGKS